MERHPVDFMMRQLEPLLDQSRETLARFVGCPSESLAWITNATAGVNTVLRSLSFEDRDEILITSHVYNACRNVIEHVAERDGAGISVVEMPFPVSSDEEIVESILAGVTPRTRLALIDHVTSPTGLVLRPIQRIVEALKARDVETLIDGAHAPGMIDFDIGRLDPAFYVGNCHKWLGAPKGAGFLYVSPGRQQEIRPLIISHGANSPRSDRSRFRLEFDFQGTKDYTPFLTVPNAIDSLGALVPGGWTELMARNRDTVLRGRHILCEATGWSKPCPDEMIGSLAAVPISDGDIPREVKDKGPDWLHDILFDQHGIEVLVYEFPPESLKWCIRVSGMIYNTAADYESLVDALRSVLNLRGRGVHYEEHTEN